jgi:hypothetical protein
MTPVKFGFEMFVLSDNDNSYMFNFKPCTGKTENLDPVFLKTTQVIKELCSSLIKDSTSPSSGYRVY